MRPSRRVHRRTVWSIVLAIALTLALYHIPGLQLAAWPLLLFSTAVHELGHGFSAALLGGDLQSLTLWPDASGVAQYSGRFSALTLATIAAAGLLGPAVAAFVLLASGRTAGLSRMALVGFAVVFAVTAVLFAGSAFTIGLCAAFALIAGLLAWRGNDHIVQIVNLFLAVQMSLAVFSRSDYLFTASAETGAGRMPSDVAQIASALWLPFWFWGGLIAVLSVALLLAGIVVLMRHLR